MVASAILADVESSFQPGGRGVAAVSAQGSRAIRQGEAFFRVARGAPSTAAKMAAATALRRPTAQPGTLQESEMRPREDRKLVFEFGRPAPPLAT